MRLLIIGGSGLLGSYLIQLGSVDNVIVGTFNSNHTKTDGRMVHLDITNKSNVEEVFSKNNPEVVILSAAITNVDLCEKDPVYAHKVNVEGTKIIAEACKLHGSKLVYVSSDYIFDGEKGWYTEEDKPSILSVYGKTKFEGECVVTEILNDYLIIRPAVIFGWHPCGKQNYVTWIIDSLKSGKGIYLLTDQYVTPTYAYRAAETLIKMIENGMSGLYHLSGGIRINRYDFGLKVAKVFELDENLIHPTTMKELGLTAKRPKDSSLSINKITKEMKMKVCGLDEELKRMRDEL